MNRRDALTALGASAAIASTGRETRADGHDARAGKANPVAHWYVFPAALVGNTATFSITDDGLGDDDLAANGSIVDPGGPGFGPQAPIPTLSEWAMALIAGLLLMFGMGRLRRVRN